MTKVTDDFREYENSPIKCYATIYFKQSVIIIIIIIIILR